jgi:hypothetical protein
MRAVENSARGLVANLPVGGGRPAAKGQPVMNRRLLVPVQTLLSITAATLVSACSSASVESVCNICENEVKDCIAEGLEHQAKSEKAGCAEPFQDYLDCVQANGTCGRDGKIDVSACDPFERVLDECD